MHWNLSIHHWRDHAIHVIFVAKQTVLTRHAALVAALAKILFHPAEIRRKNLRIALLEALEIRAAFFEVMAGQTTAIFQCAEMRFMNKPRKASPLRFGRRLREIDESSFALDIVNTVAFRA